jgi:hypothetical protein
MRFLFRAIFWLALAYALIPSRAPVPPGLETPAPHSSQPAPDAAADGSGLARDAIRLCLDNTKACAAGVEAVSKMATMARSVEAHFSPDPAPAATTPAGTTPATTSSPVGPRAAHPASSVPLPPERPGSGL